MNMNENRKKNKHNSGTSTWYRCIYILTAASKGVTKTKDPPPPYHKKSIPQCADVVFYSSDLLLLEKANL